MKTMLGFVSHHHYPLHTSFTSHLNVFNEEEEKQLIYIFKSKRKKYEHHSMRE